VSKSQIELGSHCFVLYTYTAITDYWHAPGTRYSTGILLLGREHVRLSTSIELEE
jgi:hypothetical protein